MLFSCLILMGSLACYLFFLHSVSHIINNFLTNYFLFIYSLSLFYHFSTFLHISPFVSLSAAPAQKRFCFLRSKSQDKLLPTSSSPSPSSTRPSLSLTRRLRFWSSSDITADVIASQPISANGVF